MTEKRFKVYSDSYSADIVDENTKKNYNQLEDIDDLCDLLNELNNENNNLKLINRRSNNEYLRQKDRLKRLHKDWDKLYLHLTDMGLMTEEEILKVIGYD